MESLFSISPWDNFYFLDFSSWPNWICWFERFQIVAGLNGKKNKYHVNSLIYAVGDEADNILGLSESDKEIEASKGSFWQVLHMEKWRHIWKS